MKNPPWFKLHSHFLAFATALVALVASTSLHAQKTNPKVLIIGSTHDGGDRFGGKSDPFVPTQIATELRNILSGAGLGTVNVATEERYATGSDNFGSSYSYNLASWYHWPYPAGIEATRWANLRGELGTAWDYVVLIGDPHTMENFPGLYAHGVEMIAREVTKGSAEVILLMPWPADRNNQSSVAHYKEVVYRAGRTGGYKVAPAALAWVADGSQTATSHPSPRGAYICAASIYSRIWGQSASNSSYTYNDTLADLVNTTVTNNVGVPQFSGSKMNFQNPWLMLGDKRRDVHFSEKGTSTENNYLEGVKRAMDRARVSYNDAYRRTYTSNTPADDGNAIWTTNPMPIAWNHGRDGTASQSYVVNPNYWQLAFTFHFHLDSVLYSVDEANDFCLARIYSHEVLQANNLSKGGASQRNAAWRLMWGQFHQKYPGNRPVRDSQWHVARPTEDAVGAFMYTLYSGRCPVTPGEEINEAGYARRLGYETAWRLGTGSARAPGFKVMPSAKTALTVTPTTKEAMTVQFLMQPRNNVTVQVSSSNTSAAIVGPQELVFTPSNYNVPQTVTVAGVAGSTVSAPFNVVYTTTSDDPAYHELSDSWAYTTTRTATSVTHVNNGTVSYSTPKNFAINTSLNASGASSANTTVAGPNNGTLSWSGSNVIYTPNTGYIGPDGFAYWTLNGGTLTTGYIAINVIDGYPDGSVRAEATDSIATEEGETTGTFTIIREGATTSSLSVNFAMSGSATFTDDYTLSASSPVTIPAGQSSIDIILTPVDDTVSGEYTETAALTITAGSGYIAISNPATIYIVDNDNTAPLVNAGTNQEVTLNPSTPWTPQSIIENKAWYDASDASTITHSNGAVSQWGDKSGNGYHLAGSGGREPVTGARTINGLNAIDFQNGDIMSVANRLGFGVNPDIMAFLVMQVDSTGQNTGAIFNFGNSANRLRTGTFGGSIGWYYDGGNEKYDATTTGTPFIGCWQRPSGGNYVSASFYQNGAERSATASASGTASPVDNTSVFAIGGDPSNTSFIDAAIAEVVFVGSNDVDLRKKMEGYLAHKWGLTANLPTGHLYETAAPGTPGITANLDGTVTDADGDPTTKVWTLVSGPAGATVIFGNASLEDTTATFWETGTYVLRLTADDGYGPVYADVTITVNPPLSALYSAWAGGTFANAFTATGLTDNPDGDSSNNMMEFAFGTDPTINDEGIVAVDGSAHGAPMMQKGAVAGSYEFLFVRRKDHGASGSVRYTVQFSSDLGSFTNSLVTPTLVANSIVNPAYEVVKVPFTAEARFGRLSVEIVP